MAIYRGPGGSGDATNDATSQSIIATQAATEAAESAIQAAASAVSASNSATAASNSESAASTSATNASNFADDAADYATAAASALDEFTDLYLGAKTTNPSLDNDGNALQTGALYFNTVANEFRVYTGIEWQVITVGAVGDSVITQRFSGDGNTVAFTLSTEPFSENSTFVYINGAYQQKNTYNVSGLTLTFSEAPPSGADNIEVLTITMVDIDNITASIINIADAGGYYASSKVEGALQEAATFTHSGTGAVLRTKTDKLKETVSVKDFGAVGDGVTDDTQAIQNAIDSGAKIVNGVEGEQYLITDTLTISVDKFTFDLARCELLLDDSTGLKSHILIGNGVTQLGGTVIQNTIFTRVQAATAGYAIDTDYVGNAKFTDCVIYGDSKIYGGIRIYKGIQVEVSNNHILGCVQQSVYLEGAGTGADRTIDITIRENRIEDGVNGLVTWDFVEGVYCRDNIFFNQSTACVSLNSSTNAKGLSSFKLQENDFDTSITGVYIQNISAIQISDNWFSNISNKCLLVDTNANGGTIADNVIITAVLGIEMRGKAFTINGNYITGAGTGIAFGNAATIFNVSNNLIQTDYAIDVTANPTYTLISNNTFKNLSGAIAGLGGTQTMFEGNLGDNSRGQTLSLAVGASPFTYTSGPRPEQVAIIGGNVSSVYVGGNVMSGTSVANLNISLPPRTSMVVTYSVAPLMTALHQ